jgi:hypothetical protein
MAEGRDEEKRRGYGWGLAALVVGGLLPLVLPVASVLVLPRVGLSGPGHIHLARPAYFYAMPVMLGVVGLCAVVLAATALLHRGRGKTMAVVGLLLGVGWLALGGASLHATPKGLATGCLANTRQLALGIGMYATDNDHCLPPSDRWPEAIFPYVKNQAVYSCPIDGTHDPKYKGPLDAPFSMNRYLSLAPVKGTEGVPLLFDGDGLSGDETTAAFRHFHGLNVSYTDAHARWLSREEFLGTALEPRPTP